MRVKAVLLLECAVIGLAAVSQKVAFGAEPVLVKLRLSTSLTAARTGVESARQADTVFAMQVASAAGLTLQLSAWGGAPAQGPSGGGGSGGDPLRLLERVVLPERRRDAANKPEAPLQDAATAKADAGSATDGNNAGGGIVANNTWKLAPIRWGGEIQEVLRYTSMNADDSTSNSLSNMQLFNLRAASYLWQPWFATVSGDLGLMRDATTSESSESTSTSVNGSASVTVFPVSRFPFTATFSSSNSLTDSTQYTEETRSKRYSLQQSYRPLIGNSSYTAAYIRDTLTSKRGGDDTVEKWNGTYSNTLGNHNLHLEAGRTETSRKSQVDEGMRYDTLQAQHHYSPSINLSIDNNVTLTDMSLRTASVGSTVNQNNLRYLQASSNASWRPKETLPLTFTGMVQLFDVTSEYAGISTDTQSLLGNVTAAYQATPNLSLGASVMVTQIKSGDEGAKTSSSQSGSASYSGDPIMLGGFHYGWSTSLGASNSMGDGVESSQTIMASAGHSLYRNYDLSPRVTMGVNANQSLSTRWDSIIGQNSTLTTTGTLSWRVTPSDSMSGSISLSATDTRTVGTEESEYQFISLTTEGRKQLSSYSSAAANFSVYLNRTGTRKWETLGADATTVSESPGRVTLNTVGSASYQHTRAFNVRNLHYSALATMNMQQTDSRLLGDQDASADPVEYALEQHLNYAIGRLNIRLTGTATVRNGKEDTFIYLQIGRTFGAY